MTSARSGNAKPVGRCVAFDVPVELHLVDTPSDPIHGNIRQVGTGVVELSSPIYLRENLKLEMACEGRRIQSRVAYCRRQPSGKFDIGIRMSGDSYMRSETRMPVDLTTKLHVAGSPAPLPVRVIDMSPSGLGMELTTPVPVGARVSVQLGYRTALGEMRHCARTGQHYRAGVRLERVIRCNDTSGAVWTNLNSGAGNLEVLTAVLRVIDERQSRSEAILLSLARPPVHAPTRE